ncbi:MAG: aminodeoxychorismate/anthranilate synthase component II [Gammaproteobacteria bacterium]|nr:aminodeoxychorismate/anthranilate synthase component II [Gammaproteobacteria bacterium]
MILILDNYDSFTHNLYQAVAKHNIAVKIVRNDQLTIAQVAALNPQGIIISPGPGRPEETGIGLELIRRLAPVVPILGVCLGHQMIVSAFGGEVVLAAAAVHGKEDVIFHHRQGIYQDMPLPFKAGRYHSLIAEKHTLPKQLIIEAESADSIVMGVRHQHYSTYGVQFHPESILTPDGDKLINNFIQLCYAHQPAEAA